MTTRKPSPSLRFYAWLACAYVCVFSAVLACEVKHLDEEHKPCKDRVLHVSFWSEGPKECPHAEHELVVRDDGPWLCRCPKEEQDDVR